MKILNHLIYTIIQQYPSIMTKMHADEQEAMWICQECQTIFLFYDDTIRHTDSTGHKVIEKRAMISLAETFAQ
jgi:hypothetical protein